MSGSAQLASAPGRTTPITQLGSPSPTRLKAPALSTSFRSVAAGLNSVSMITPLPPVSTTTSGRLDGAPDTTRVCSAVADHPGSLPSTLAIVWLISDSGFRPWPWPARPTMARGSKRQGGAGLRACRAAQPRAAAAARYGCAGGVRRRIGGGRSGGAPPGPECAGMPAGARGRMPSSRPREARRGRSRHSCRMRPRRRPAGRGAPGSRARRRKRPRRPQHSESGSARRRAGRPAV